MDTTTDQLSTLLERAYAGAADVLDRIPPGRWDAPTPCSEWTVRQLANHVVGSLDALARIVTFEFDPAEASADGPEPDLLGADPAGALRTVADRCRTLFADPGVHEREYPFLGGSSGESWGESTVSGRTVAHITLSEALVHGWDLARGAGVPYRPDPGVVDAVVARVAADSNGDTDGDTGVPGMFAPPVPTPADVPALTWLLARLGRAA